jgi:hypothetical protein
MTRAITLLLVLVSATASADTFETHAQSAVRIRHVDDLVWALTATCDNGDDVQQRQCRHLRDRKAKALLASTILVEGEASAFDIGKWNAAKKSVPLALTACVRCGGVELDGRTFYITGAQPRLEGGKVRAAVLYDNARPFPDEAAATAWTKSLRQVRVELVAKIPDKRKLPLAGKAGLVLEIVAWRVVSPCDGSIVIASPDSGPVAPDKQACGPAAAAPKR